MVCKKFELLASAHLDQQLADGEAADYRAHLSSCADCRAHLSELEQVSLMLKGATELGVPRELHSYIMNSLERRASSEGNIAQRAFEWLLMLNPRFVSYVAGVVVSVVLFSGTLLGFRPLPEVGASGRRIIAFPVTTGPVITSSDVEYTAYNDLPPVALSASGEHYYELPRMLDNSALVSFSRIAAPGPEGMAALVEVSADGHAQLVDVLQEPRDPYLVEQLWWSLSKHTFQPAMVGGKPVPTRIVLLVEKVDVSG